MAFQLFLIKFSNLPLSNFEIFPPQQSWFICLLTDYTFTVLTWINFKAMAKEKCMYFALWLASEVLLLYFTLMNCKLLGSILVCDHIVIISLSLSLSRHRERWGSGGGGGEKESITVQAYIYIYVQGNYIYIDIYCAGKWGEEWGKQVGSMTGESQVSNCYNFYLHQPGNVCVGKDTSKQYI